MAYKNLTNKACANRAVALTQIWTMIESMGWILHDNMDASSYRVYKSDGELADRIPEYIKIVWTTANQFAMVPYLSWNNITHAGLSGSAGGASYSITTTSETGFYFWCYGNKDLVVFATKVAGVYCLTGFGHIPKRFWTLLTNLTLAATAGAGVSITVAATAGFEAGYSYQIVGNNDEGRDWIAVTSITDATHMIITNLPRNYASGAKIGNCPSTFGVIGTGSGAFVPTCPKVAVGTNDAGVASGANFIITSVSACAPDVRLNKYVFCACYWTEGNAIDGLVGYSDTYFLTGPTAGLANEDTLGIGQQDSGTSSGTNDSSHLNDTSKAWATNAWANKVLIITFGTGGGQIEKIASNTGTQLTLDAGSTFTTIPDNTSTYVICDEGYRYLYASNFQLHVFAEAI